MITIDPSFEPPSDKLFTEMKTLCLEVMNCHRKKDKLIIQNVKNLPNVSDNFMYMLDIFETKDKRRLYSMASDELKKAIIDRYDEEYNYIFA